MITKHLEWDYTDHPLYPGVLRWRTSELLKRLWDGSISRRDSIIDTRLIHRYLFKDLVPKEIEYFAGHYRGEEFPFLQDYKVTIDGNPSVGLPPQYVLSTMSQFSEKLKQVLSTMDAFHETETSQSKKLEITVDFACEAFINITKIHPYANGNGHMGRFLLISILRNYGYELMNWTLDPRPQEPLYTNLIRLYEQGEKEYLHRYIVQNILLS